MPQPDLPDLPSGPSTTPSTPTSTTTSTSPAQSTGPSLAEQRAMERLRVAYQEILRRWGLKASKNLLNLMERGIRGQWSTTQFIDMLRHTPEYRKQFRGIRWRTGMTEGQYLSTYAQYKARAQDIGERFSRKMFAKTLKNGLTFEEFSDRVDAVQTIDQYAPMWAGFQQALELRGIALPGGKLTKKELQKFVMGLGPKKWEQVWQEAFLTTQLERVAGIEVTAPRAGEVATPDSYGLTRKDMLQVIKQVEALNPGFEFEKLSGQDFAELGKRVRQYDIQYLQRYGLTTKDLLEMEFGGPRAAQIAERAERILAEQEAFLEPRAVSQAPTQRLQGAEFEEELPQSL